MDTLLHWAASQGLEQFALTLLQQGNTDLHSHRIVMVRNDLFIMHNVEEISSRVVDEIWLSCE